MIDTSTSSLVSICIPTYNGEQFIAETLDSVIVQKYSNLEIIVSDDASSDKTLSIIETYKAKTNIPIYIYHHQPNGIGANWNHCILKSKGDYIKFLFQDDVLLPNCVEEMLIVLEKDDNIGLVASKRTFIFDTNYSFPNMEQWIENFGDLQKNLDLKSENGLIIIDKSLFKSKQFLNSPLNKIGEPSVFMFRKAIVSQIGFFREDLIQILDYEFCYRLLKTHRIVIINKELVKFRLHSKQATNINRHKRGIDNGDNEGYSKILYKGYLNYVDSYTKRHLLKKYNFYYKLFYKLKSILKKST